MLVHNWGCGTPSKKPKCPINGGVIRSPLTIPGMILQVVQTHDLRFGSTNGMSKLEFFFLAISNHGQFAPKKHGNVTQAGNGACSANPIPKKELKCLAEP